MAQQLRVRTALVEDMSLFPRNLWAAHNHQLKANLMPLTSTGTSIHLHVRLPQYAQVKIKYLLQTPKY